MKKGGKQTFWEIKGRHFATFPQFSQPLLHIFSDGILLEEEGKEKYLTEKTNWADADSGRRKRSTPFMFPILHSPFLFSEGGISWKRIISKYSLSILLHSWTSAVCTRTTHTT